MRSASCVLTRCGAACNRPALAGSFPASLAQFDPLPKETAMPRFAMIAAVLAVAIHATLPAGAATLRWAGRGDINTTDPHSQNENLTNNVNSLVYEFLVTRDRSMKIIPALAQSWKQVDATTWRFNLRPGVRFHDGTPFTADDVVFSFARASAPTSQLHAYAKQAGVPKKIDDMTVEFTTPGPNPAMLEHLITINIMSRAWCEKNHAMTPQNFMQKQDMVTAHQANGTGPYKLVSRQPDVKTVLKKNPDWWGIKAGRFEGNVDEVDYLPIVSDATRVAALVSGDVDLINDPPPQDVPRLAKTSGIKVQEGVENRIVFIGMDQKRDELLYSSVKGKNPLKDRRVREALYRAIDIEAIRRTTMRGLSRPTGALSPGPEMTTPEIEKRLPFDRGAARTLLADAGYPKGFEVTLDCPNNRYVNDEKICQALAVMWAQVGVVTRVNAMPRALYFPKLEKTDTSLYMLGWGGAATDAIFILQPVLSSYNGKGDGDFNYGRYTNPRIDELTAKIKVDMNAAERLDLIHQAFLAHNAEINHLPLHRQVIPWASRSNVSVQHRPDNWVIPMWATVK
jgi:peptide/nickel transport system substrate-binding protein